MATSGTRDTAETVGQLITDALIEIHVLEENETATAAQTAKGIRWLRRMMRTWNALGCRLWLTDEEVITLAADTATYTLSPRYIGFDYALRRSSAGEDTPIRIYTREEYNRLPNKTASGAPFVIWFDRQAASTVATVYPVPSAVGDTIRVQARRVVEDPTAVSETMEVPPEWSEAMMYNLAVRMAPGEGVDVLNPITVQMAASLYDQMSGQDREGSVFMRPRAG